MSAQSGWADWLKAIHELKPAGDGELDAIAGMLGLRLRSGAKPAPTPRRRKREEPPPLGKITEFVTGQTRQERMPRRRLESVLTPQDVGHNPVPQWLAAARHLEPTDAAHIRPLIPLEPLFPARTARAILSGALATPSANGPLHLPKVIELLSRAEAIQEIPRLSIPTLARGVQLLIDRSMGMQPFASDQAILRAALLNVVGSDRTRVLYFEGSPLWGAGSGPKDEWPDYAAPTANTPVLALTDLGIAQPPGVAGLAGTADWLDFAKILARASCPLLVLVPYPRERWPPSLLKHMTIFQWDRATTASVISREIRAGLRAAKGV